MFGLSIAAMVGGIALMLIPGLGILGSILLSAGANSLINGYMLGTDGEISEAGWWSGAAYGALFALGVSGGGALAALALKAGEFAGFAGVVIGWGIAASTSYYAGFGREYLYSYLSGTNFDRDRAVLSGQISMFVGILAYPFAFFASALGSPTVSGSVNGFTSFGLRGVQTYFSICGEVVADIIPSIIDAMKNNRPIFV